MKRPELLDFLQSYFLTERQRILNQAANLNKVFSNSGESVGKDEGDIASHEFEQGMQLRMINRDLLYLNKIDQSLEKIQSGEFGECGSCMEEIENQRLVARPTATLCFSCKEEEERLEMSTIDGKTSKSTQHTYRSTRVGAF